MRCILKFGNQVFNSAHFKFKKSLNYGGNTDLSAFSK